jgi:SIR2-like domain
MAESMNEVEKGMEQRVNPPDEIALLRLPQYAEPVEEATRLLSQSKRAFLLGAGCGKCGGLPDMEELTEKVLSAIPQTNKIRLIFDGLVKQFAKAKGCTIEDYMSELVDLISIADRRVNRGAATAKILIDNTEYSSTELRAALATIKQKIENTIIGEKIKIHTHRQFVRAVHGRLQLGKTVSSEPVDYFTLNYDTLLEDALSLERVPLADGFNGGATGWWNVNAYSDPPVLARVFKLHGSIDWCLLDDDMLPRRIRHALKDDKEREPVLIWPASTKYMETQRDPFAQILNIMRRSLRPAQNSEVILAVVGYSFGDSHINEELDRALIESDGRLTIIVFANIDKPDGVLEKWQKDSHLKENVRIHGKHGFYHGDNQIESETDLPWWKFEILVRLLGGER